jgi:hypothetical protein
MKNKNYHLVVPTRTASEVYAEAKARYYASLREWDYVETLAAREAVNVAFEALPYSWYCRPNGQPLDTEE